MVWVWERMDFVYKVGPTQQLWMELSYHPYKWPKING